MADSKDTRPDIQTYRAFLKGIETFIPAERVYTDELRTLCWGTDAGFYRKIPRIVIRSYDEEEVSRILQVSSALGVPVTFRAAGTSLSGQAVSDSVIIVAGKNWEKYSIGDGTITMQPGLVGSRVNAILAPRGRRFGPDPASIASCMVGGIVMNNASGMSCGTHANSDRTLISCRIVFADGTVLDTGSSQSRKDFIRSHGDFLTQIEKLRDEVQSDSELSERIRYKYSIKNVTGLNILPFVMYTDPFDIITHLMVGSEGTLGFVSEVTMKTLPIAPFKASAMIYFRSITDAARGVLAMKKCQVSAAELLDKRSLRSVDDPVYLAAMETYPDLTAVLTEVQAPSKGELSSMEASISKALESMELYTPEGQAAAVHFTSDPKEYGRYWAIRSGIFPTVGAMRKEGTTCLIEDIAFHIADLPGATKDLSDLLDAHGYDDSCIYGHALEGNFHFIINQSFDSEQEVRRYAGMIRDVAKMVVGKYDGSLKAEHGTGRNMAPFVKYEWGEKAFSVMRRVKDLFDPKGLLNPGVIFNDDPDCFIKDFKALPMLSPSSEDPKTLEAYGRINKCIECGFCEVNCVSCGFTLSSRTRIVAQRMIASLKASGDDPSLLRKLQKQYRYYGDDTCAADGLCSTSCPMGINVADLTHEIRCASTPPSSLRYKGWKWAGEHFSTVEGGIRGALRLASFGKGVIGTKAMAGLCRNLHSSISLPLWTPSTPKAYNPSKAVAKASASPSEGMLKVVYFPSCLNQMMGLPDGSKLQRPLVEETLSLLSKAGYSAIFPRNMEKLCCGMMWESKGMPDIADKKSVELFAALMEASGDGEIPILCDQSPCLHRMREKMPSLKLYEPAEFIMKFLVPRLTFTKGSERVAVHVTCSTRLMHLESTLLDLVHLCTDNVIVPEGVGCCGFAGDKGMTRPELNRYALRKLRSEVDGAEEGFSNSRTCEIGLSTHSGIQYSSVVYLVNRHTVPKRT